MIHLTLFLEFFKIGLFSVGGGLATLPFLYKLAEKRPDWLSLETIADMIAISESTPGPIGINMATYAGYQVAGVLGGIVATLGEVTPSIIVIVVIAKFLSEFDRHPLVKSAFYGLRAAVVGLITFALLKLLSATLFPQGSIDLLDSALYLLLVALVLVFRKAHPLLWILLGALIGLVKGLPS
ncbi:MAG: chromate transporter [Spirochaetales bacterium]|nr:chromate transporter [Spirochaetales bacterium]